MREIVEQQLKESYPNAEEERLDLARMEEESKELIMLAELLVRKVQDGYTATRRASTSPRGNGPLEGSIPEITVDDVSTHSDFKKYLVSIAILARNLHYEVATGFTF